MVRVQKNILSLFLWSFTAMACSDRFAIIEVGSPSKRRAEILQAFCNQYSLNAVDDKRTIFPVGQVSPHEIILQGCPPDAYFKECVLRVDGDKMAAAWLRNFFSDTDVAQCVSQESLDEMLAFAVEMPSVSPGLIEQLLSYGADPCAGSKPPIESVFIQLTSLIVDVKKVTEKLCMMLGAMRKEPRLIQYENESFADANKRFMVRVAKRVDCKVDLRRKFGEFGQSLSDEAYVAYCREWKQICELLSERRLRGSGNEQNSPFRKKKTAFERFAIRSVDTCAALDAMQNKG